LPSIVSDGTAGGSTVTAKIQKILVKMELRVAQLMMTAKKMVLKASSEMELLRKTTKELSTA
jgi:hypothetical protein